jgi:hypothetical protein
MVVHLYVSGSAPLLRKGRKGNIGFEELGMFTDDKTTESLVMAMLFLMGAAVARSEESLSAAQAPRPHHPIPTRSRQANQDLVDLSKYYTASLDDDWLVKPGANLASLPKGVQAFARAAFDVRGLIQLASKKALMETHIDFSQAVKGITIHHKARRLHFLQGAAWSVDADTKIGEYVLHYANGQTRGIPIVYQRHVKDWWVKPEDPVLPDADIAWTGENEASHKLGYRIQLYRYTINSPLPDHEIETIDFVSTMTDSAPFLIALTVEPNKPVYEGFKAVTIDNPIPPRDPQAGPDLVDLSAYFNASLDDDWFQHPGHDLQDVPRGVQTLGGVPFDVRGLIQLAGTESLRVTGVVLPEVVRDIQVNRKGRRLHFLQACGWHAPEGAEIGQYVIHYADGQTRTAPMIFGRNVTDWWVGPNTKLPTEAQEVWCGSNPSTRHIGSHTHLLKYTWENPRPHDEIRTIDFVSNLTEAWPFLVAITIEEK